MPLPVSTRARFAILCAASLVIGCGSVAAKQAATMAHQQANAVGRSAEERIEPYHARFGRTRPVIAVVGENNGTELTDYVIPYGILRQADVAEVISVATQSGPLTLRPALRIQPQASIADFDARYPEGADYVIVPAVVRQHDPALLAWIKLQASKGGTLVSICDGAIVVANTGMMDGHRATAHWATASFRRKNYPQIRWMDDRRYVADGKIVSSAGISAALPISLALVEAIAGHERAADVAAKIGAVDWSSTHDSRPFHPKLGRNLTAFATTEYFNHWFHKPIMLGIPVSTGVDEVSLAFTADAYARTGRARPFTVSSGQTPVETLHGLVLLPDQTDNRASTGSMTVPIGKPALALDKALAEISRRYGRQTAYGVALGFEYPGFHD